MGSRAGELAPLVKTFAVLAELVLILTVERVRISLGNRVFLVEVQTSVSTHTMVLRADAHKYAVLLMSVGRVLVVIAQPISRVVKRQTPVMGMA